MREISPAVNISAEEYLQLLDSAGKRLVAEIRQQKQLGHRPKPSATVIDRSGLLKRQQRDLLIDAVAMLVDENLAGRSAMCIQFADLLHRALTYLKLPSRAASGWPIYYSASGDEIFRLKHAWVRVGSEVIDANVDSLYENPVVPKAVRVAPYWGPIREVPPDRHLREEHGVSLPPDTDVSDIWWPELRTFIENHIEGSA